MSSETPSASALAERRGRSKLPFPVVGIVASAGGLSALTRLFEHMPPDPGMAFVVILQLSQRHESVAHTILQRVTLLPVEQAANGVVVKANHVYVIPSSKHLFMESDGRLRLGDMDRPLGSHRAIDLFFSDLAEVQGERAVAVVLSGSGADGSRGLQRIKQCGGVTLVQSPSDSEHGGMPLNAMAAGAADFVLPAADMPQKLQELWHHAPQIQWPGELRAANEELQSVNRELKSKVDEMARFYEDLKTETQRAQQQTEALLRSEQSLRAQLQAANEQKDEFLAVMSHELKNPLNLIALNAELLKRLPETRGVSSAVRIADTIRASVDSQAQIINDLLDLSRMQTGKLFLSRSLVPWDEVMQRISEAVQSDAAAAGLTLTLQMQGSDFTVHGDPVRLEQIAWNLVSNAIKFTPAGGRVQLVLRAEHDEICLDVADTGRGIEPDFMARLFDMFSQADSGTARRGGGLGIGLALSKRLIEMHGGRLQVQSAGRDQGSTFTVRLAHANAERLRRSAPSARDFIVNKLKLLVVDDQPDTLASFAALLETEGAQLTLAGSGEEALRLAGEQPFDFLISDLAMPGMDGYMLLARLRQAGHAMPAIAVSGMGRSSDRERALQAGFEALVSKPVELEALLDVVARTRRLAEDRVSGV